MTLSLRAPSDLLAAIPYLVGYHPTDSVVVLGLHGARLTFSARLDLPEPADLAEQPDLVEDWVQHLVEVVVRQHCTAALVVGFGPADRTDPLLAPLCLAYQSVGVLVYEMLRAHDGRYWSYLCHNEHCCPPEGTPYDPIGSPLAAEWTMAGLVARRNRDEYESQLRGLTGPAREAMVQATAAAHDRLITLLAGAADERRAETEVLLTGRAALTDAVDRLRAGGRLTDDEAAWLSVLLMDTQLRDLAWLRAVKADDEIELHRTLWMDVLRRCEPDLVAAPATLFGFAAWRCGDGGLARLAFERAIAADPDGSLPQSLLRALNRGLPPTIFDDLADPVTVRSRRGPGRRRRSSSRHVGSRPA